MKKSFHTGLAVRVLPANKQTLAQAHTAIMEILNTERAGDPAKVAALSVLVEAVRPVPITISDNKFGAMT